MYLLAGGRHRADWVRNLVADPDVTVRIANQSLKATARVVEAGTDEDVVARNLVLQKYQALGHRDLEAWGRSALAVAVDLSEDKTTP